MDGQRQTGALNDTALEDTALEDTALGDTALGDTALAREIEAALAVDPSPEFVARVRSRVAAEPSSSAWRMWMPALAAVAVVAVVLAVLWPKWWSKETPLVATAPARGAAETIVATVPDSAPVRPVSRPPAAQDRRSPPIEARHAIVLPEVILARNEAGAYATLMVPGRETQLRASLPGAPDLSAPVEVDKMPKIDPVTLDPIEVEPIVQAALERLE
ncbi:MAG TPA: hypothetical protein VGF24_06110 [Vicinamibacterales bacterium]|jgi:hypothetical protein